MTNKNIGIVAVVIIVVIAIGGFFYPQSKTVLQNIGANPIQNEIVGTEEFIVNGVKHVYKTCVYFPTATTTPCKMATPIGTSTLVYFSNVIHTGTSSALVYDLGTSTNPFATSTIGLIHQRAVASGAKDAVFLAATTSAASAATNQTGVYSFTSTSTDPRNPTGQTFLVLKTGNTTGGFGYVLGGVMKAEFIVSN